MPVVNHASGEGADFQWDWFAAEVTEALLQTPPPVPLLASEEGCGRGREGEPLDALAFAALVPSPAATPALSELALHCLALGPPTTDRATSSSILRRVNARLHDGACLPDDATFGVRREAFPRGKRHAERRERRGVDGERHWFAARDIWIGVRRIWFAM